MFFIFFIGIPIIEVILFITIGKYIGLWNTILIIIITGIIGAILVKSQGISTLKKGLEEIKSNNIKIDGQIITDVLTVNGIRFSFQDGSWGLIRASSNKPSLVVVTESPTSNERKKKIFKFIDSLLQKTGKIGDYDQKI